MDTRNRVLRALPRQDRRKVLEKCERVELQSRTILDRVGQVATVVHFPETAAISTIATYPDGSSIELASFGREAFTGIGLTLDHPRKLTTSRVQIGGDALEMPADFFCDLRSSLPSFNQVVLAAVKAMFHQVMVSGACNGRHVVKQRLARSLLTMCDRTDSEVMPLTHEFLADMLGVRRATVTEALHVLQSGDVIESSRKEIRILDRPGLRYVSCECYDLVRNAYDELIPNPNTAL